jgi:hypothetical protein
MSSQIQDWQVKQFNANVTRMFQQNMSKFRGTTREHPAVTGNTDFWDRIGPIEAIQKTTRHADTPYIETPHSRRACYITDWHIADLVDWSDLARILADPKAELPINFAKSLARRVDRLIIAAFDASVQTDETGGTAVTFANDWSVRGTATARSGSTGDWDFTAAALTVPNLASLKMDLDLNDVDPEGRHIAMDPSGLKQLLSASSAPQLTNADYATVKALVQGEVDTFMGFKFHTSTLMPNPSGNLYYGYAWQENAMGLSMAVDMDTSVDKRPDKSNNWQVYSKMALGSVRVQGEGLVRFKIDNTK